MVEGGRLKLYLRAATPGGRFDATLIAVAIIDPSELNGGVVEVEARPILTPMVPYESVEGPRACGNMVYHVRACCSKLLDAVTTYMARESNGGIYIEPFVPTASFCLEL